jgi:uncharacterized protein (DUF1330 family)
MANLLITIGKLNPDGKEALGRYATGVIPLIEAAGGTVLARGALSECVVGSPVGQPDLVAVMRFPSAQAIRDFFESEAYRANLAHRNQAFREVRSYIADDLM